MRDDLDILTVYQNWLEHPEMHRNFHDARRARSRAVDCVGIGCAECPLMPDIMINMHPCTHILNELETYLAHNHLNPELFV